MKKNQQYFIFFLFLILSCLLTLSVCQEEITNSEGEGEKSTLDEKEHNNSVIDDAVDKYFKTSESNTKENDDGELDKKIDNILNSDEDDDDKITKGEVNTEKKEENNISNNDETSTNVIDNLTKNGNNEEKKEENTLKNEEEHNEKKEENVDKINESQTNMTSDKKDKIANLVARIATDIVKETNTLKEEEQTKKSNSEVVAPENIHDVMVSKIKKFNTKYDLNNSDNDDNEPMKTNENEVNNENTETNNSEEKNKVDANEISDAESEIKTEDSTLQNLSMRKDNNKADTDNAISSENDKYFYSDKEYYKDDDISGDDLAYSSNLYIPGYGNDNNNKDEEFDESSFYGQDIPRFNHRKHDTSLSYLDILNSENKFFSSKSRKSASKDEEANSDKDQLEIEKKSNMITNRVKSRFTKNKNTAQNTSQTNTSTTSTGSSESSSNNFILSYRAEVAKPFFSEPIEFDKLPYITITDIDSKSDVIYICHKNKIYRYKGSMTLIYAENPTNISCKKIAVDQNGLPLVITTKNKIARLTKIHGDTYVWILVDVCAIDLSCGYEYCYFIQCKNYDIMRLSKVSVTKFTQTAKRVVNPLWIQLMKKLNRSRDLINAAKLESSNKSKDKNDDIFNSIVVGPGRGMDVIYIVNANGQLWKKEVEQWDVLDDNVNELSISDRNDLFYSSKTGLFVKENDSMESKMIFKGQTNLVSAGKSLMINLKNGALFEAKTKLV
jgi:hypothetical protein